MIYVNADREPANIAAVIEHELLHGLDLQSARTNLLGPFGEACAVKLEQWAEQVFGARPDGKSPIGPPNPKADCR
jgi:hypothetical protein